MLGIGIEGSQSSRICDGIEVAVTIDIVHLPAVINESQSVPTVAGNDLKLASV